VNRCSGGSRRAFLKLTRAQQQTLKRLLKRGARAAGFPTERWTLGRLQHVSEAVLRYFFDHPEIIVEPLPKYAPELNPEEYCHGNVKTHLANATPADVPDLRQSIDRGFARLRRRPDLLLSFIQAAGLSAKQLIRK
jgi:transposase